MHKFYVSIIVLILCFLLTYQNNGYAQIITQSTRSSTESVLSKRKIDGKVQIDSDNKVQVLSVAKVNGTVYFSEDFDGIPGSTTGGIGTYVFPSGWVLANVDGLTPASSVYYVNDAWERREDFKFNIEDSAAFSTSWYSPTGQADDWMITPAINIGANTILKWNAVAYDPSYPDGYEVRISTTTQDVNGCLANPALFSIAAENSAWTERSVNLSSAGYSNQTVYIAWRNHTNDKFLLLVDDIVVEEFLNYDAKITSVLQPSEYTRIPAWQNYPLSLGASVKNNGQSDLTNVKVTANVYQNSTLIYTKVSNPVPSLTSESSISISLDSYAPTDTGIIEIQYIVSSDETDLDSTNNIGTSNQIYITENEFARDDNNLTGSLGIGASNGGEMGQDFLLNVAGYIRNVKFYFDRCYPNQPVHATIRSFENGKPSDIIAVTDTFYAPDLDARWITLNISGGESAIPAETIVVNINEEDSTLALGLTNDIFTPKTTWVNWPTNPLGDWSNSEDFGFTKPFMIRPFIYENQITTDINQSVIYANKFGLSQNYPNPFNPSTSISFSLAHSSRVTIKVYDVLGNEVATLLNDYRAAGSYNVDFNASAFTSGVYFYELKADDFRSVRKMILMK